jgi:hypothetical protein
MHLAFAAVGINSVTGIGEPVDLALLTGYLCGAPGQLEAGMTTFDKREEGFERKFALDEEQRFKATARRNKLLGLWAAEKLGLTGADAEAYAKAVVKADFEEAGDGDVFRKIRSDFDAKGIAESDHQIRRTMDDFLVKAAEQIQSEA